MTGTITLLIIAIADDLLTPLTTTAIDTRITTGFSPGGTAMANVLTAIRSARASIDVAAYSFTSKEVATALGSASRDG